MSSPLFSNGSQVRKCFFLTYDANKIKDARSAYIAASAINSFFMFPTIVLNIILLRGMYRSRALRKPSTLLLYSLSASDLLLGVVVQPAYLIKKIGEFTDDFHLYCKAGFVTYSAGYLLATVSFLNLGAIAIDRCLLVASGLNYPVRVTHLRVSLAIMLIWMTVTTLVIGQFFKGRTFTFKCVVAIMLISVTTTTICYITAIYKIKKQQSSIQEVSETASIKRYKKSVATMLLVFVLFLVCYTPYLATMVAGSVLGESAVIWKAESITAVIAFGNGSINPLVLFWRVKEIRESGRRSINITRQSRVRTGRSRAPKASVFTTKTLL